MDVEADFMKGVESVLADARAIGAYQSGMGIRVAAAHKQSLRHQIGQLASGLSGLLQQAQGKRALALATIPAALAVLAANPVFSDGDAHGHAGTLEEIEAQVATVKDCVNAYMTAWHGLAEAAGQTPDQAARLLKAHLRGEDDRPLSNGECMDASVKTNADLTGLMGGPDKSRG